MLSQSIRRALIASSLLFGAMAALSPAAFAATANSNMGVSGSVANNCTISAGALSFGAYNTLAVTAQDGTATLSVACTTGASAPIALGFGVNGTTTQRKLTDGAATPNLLSYDLYTDAAHTAVWGNTAGTNDRAYTGTGAADTVTVYGRIPAGQNVPAGSYTDTVQATITF